MKLKRLTPGKLIPLSFLLTILIGAVLLMLPCASVPGEKTEFSTALFTATTSVCVTGLVVVDTYSHWTIFGQAVILLLIQIGGLGVVSVGAVIMHLGGQKLTLGEQKLIGDAMNVDEKRSLRNMLLRVFRGVFLVEGIGTVLFAVKLVPMLGVGEGTWAALFQSVSAFCNAGMDVIGPDSMIPFRDSGLMMGVTEALIILGGLGFVVWFDLVDAVRRGIKKRFGPARIFRQISEHSKVAIFMTAFLLAAGTIGVLAAEYHNPDTIGNMSLSGKIANSLFQSVTFRTAGFASLPQDSLTETTCGIGYLLMFIGGSPVGTAGGVKTVTVFLVFMNAISYVKGKKENVVFHRRVSEEMMRKASAVVLVSACTVALMTFLLMARGGILLTDALYEVTSALGTVGLSRSLTPHLDLFGRIVIIISMYLGRIGPISMAVLFAKKTEGENKIRHADGKFYVG